MSDSTAAPNVAPLPSGVVTFLFTDVVGSTKLFQQHGEAFADVLQSVRDAVRSAVEQAGGVVVGTEGDSTFAAFQTAEAGLCAAESAQQAVAELAAAQRVRIRAGLHTGYAQPLQGDYLAIPVHVASRVSAAAAGGQVLASGDTIARLGAPPAGAVDLGLFELRDVVEPLRLWRVAGPEAAPHASPVRRTNVQLAHTSLVGRDGVLAELAELIAEHRLVTITGTGGVGKTRIASELVGRVATSFPGGGWLVELAGVADDDGVTAAVRGELAVPADEASDDALVAELRRRGPTLLVLDNCEHVAEGAAALIERLIRTSPETRLLATSREALELPDERVLRLAPLPQADVDGPAEELFRQRAARAGAAITTGDDETVRRLCRLLDGLPLAIELVASRAASMPVAELLEALERDAHLVPLWSRRGERRQRNLDDLVDWSARLLTAAERTDLMCLSLFAARFTGHDAAVLLAAARGEGPATVPELVRRGLVDLDGDRYRMLFSVRVPMAARLAGDRALAAAADAAIVGWANDRVSAARPAGWRAALADLAPERANLESALRSALRRGLDAPRVLQMLDRIWDRDGAGPPADLRAGLEARLSAPLPDDADGLRTILSIMNMSAGVRADPRERLALAERLVAAARRLDDPEVLVDTLSTLAPIFVAAGQVEQGRAMYREAIDHAGDGGPWHRPARDLVNMAITFQIGPQPLDALPWYEAAVEAALRSSDDDNRAVALVNMGEVLMSAGRLRHASDVLRRGVKLTSHLSRSGAAARAVLAEALVRLDEPNALEFAREAERDLEQISRIEPALTEKLHRLRVTLAAAEERAAVR
jgi:predicted ATPase/class 3 adenylate cyclase